MLSTGLVHSGSAPPGLTAALSGDVVTPTTSFDGELAGVGANSFLIIDRYPAAVLTVVDASLAEVTHQIDVKTGFYSNPQDAVVARPGQLYVARYDQNPDPGRVPHDEGSDVVVVDIGSGAIVHSIELSSRFEGPRPRPARILVHEELAIVLAPAYSVGYGIQSDGEIVLIDRNTDKIVGRGNVPGLRSCGGLALSPSGRKIAVTCPGTWSGPPSFIPSLADGGVAILSLDKLTVNYVNGWSSAELGIAASPSLASPAFASEDTLMFTTAGHTEPPIAYDQLIALNIESGTVQALHTTMGLPLSLGDVRCGFLCSTCFTADAGEGRVMRLTVDSAGRVSQGESSVGEGPLWLPPRYLGGY